MKQYKVKAVIKGVARDTVVQAASHADAKAIAQSMFPAATAIWVEEIFR